LVHKRRFAAFGTFEDPDAVHHAFREKSQQMAKAWPR
jgi:hypothetical protein